MSTAAAAPTLATEGRLLVGYGLQLGGQTRLLNAPPGAPGGLVAYAIRH